jgi:hypothetical protein
MNAAWNRKLFTRAVDQRVDRNAEAPDDCHSMPRKRDSDDEFGHAGRATLRAAVLKLTRATGITTLVAAWGALARAEREDAAGIGRLFELGALSSDRFGRMGRWAPRPIPLQ